MSGTEDAQPPAQRLRRGLEASIVDNSSAFGFSIMITASFGALSRLEGQPGIAAVFGFAVGAAATFTLLQGLTSRGFRREPHSSPREVVMLGTALNFLSVGVGVGVAVLAGLVLPAGVAWAVAGFLAAGAYIVTEATELALAGGLESRLGGRSEGEGEEAG